MKRVLLLIMLMCASAHATLTTIATNAPADNLGGWAYKINEAILQVNTNVTDISGLEALTNTYNNALQSNDVGTAAFSNANHFVNTNEVPVSVKEYGAVGDDSNDDTSAIQAAIDAAVLAGRKVYFPAGIYKITSSLVVTPPDAGSIYIFGDGEGFGNGTAGSTVIKQYTSGQDGIRVTSGENVSGCVITDLNIYHNTYANRTGSGIEISYDSSQHSRIYFRNVNIQRFQKAYDLQFIDQSVIENCYATQCSYGIYMDENYVINGLDISGGAVTLCDTASIYVGYGRGISIAGMDLGNSPTDAIISIDGQSMGVNVIGCSFEPLSVDSVCVRIDSEETVDGYLSTVHLSGNVFGGALLTTTNAPVVVESENVILSLNGNHMYRYPGATPLVSVASGAEKAVIVGNPFWNTGNPSGKHGGVQYADSTFNQLSYIPHSLQSSERNNGMAERGGLVWYDAYSGGSTNDMADDLQTVYMDTSTGTNEFRRSSLLNDKIIDPLVDWATNYPASGITDVATASNAIAGLQLAINQMQPYAWATNWVEQELEMMNGTTYPMPGAVEVANGSYHCTSTNDTGGGIALFLRGETVTPPSSGGELFGSASGNSGNTYKILYRIVGTDDAVRPFRLRSVIGVDGNSGAGVLRLDSLTSDDENINNDSLSAWNEAIFVANNGSGYDQYLQFGVSSVYSDVSFDVILDVRVFEAEIVPVIP